MSTGTIVTINLRNRKFIVRLEDGDFAVFSVSDRTKLKLQAKVAGNLDAIGSATLLQLDTGEPFEAVGKTGPCQLEIARLIIG